MIGDKSLLYLISNLNENYDEFIIGKTQRLLAWGKTQWEDWWTSLELILSGKRNKVNLGNISILRTKDGKIELYDGQQRITASMLCARACSLFISNNKDKLIKSLTLKDSCLTQIKAENKIKRKQQSAERLYNSFGNTTNDEEMSDTLLKYFDKEINTIYQYLMNEDTTEYAIIKYKNTSLIKEFLFFYKKLTLDTVFNVISILSGSDSSSVGVTYGFSYLISECETPQEASDYFNNQDKGSKLLPSDHILSHLISEINIYVNDPKKSIKYEDILVNFRNELNIDELIKFYQLFIYYKDKGKNIQKTQLLPYFLKEDTSSENKICNLIDDLDKFFTCYKSIVDNTLSGKFEPINTYLRFNIDRGFFTLHFSIDLLRNEKELSKDDIRKAMELNYAVLFRRKIAGINSGSDRANIGWVDEAIKRSKSEKIKFIDALKKIIHEQPKNIVGEMDNSRFYQDMKKYDFYSDKNDSIKYLLASVEYSNKDVNEFDIFSSKIKGYSVEHIMCQVNNQNNDRLNIIGNFTLITGVTNSSLGAKPFEEKKEGYEKSNLWINKYFSDKEKWDETDIDLRTDYLIDLIIKAGFLNI